MSSLFDYSSLQIMVLLLAPFTIIVGPVLLVALLESIEERGWI